MIRCVGLIPAEQEADPRTGLNVLVMAVNEGEKEAGGIVRLFGSLEKAPKELAAKHCVLGPGEHAHLYFHIPPCCFSADFWDGEEPEEMTVFAGINGPETPGKMVFIQL